MKNFLKAQLYGLIRTTLILGFVFACSYFKPTNINKEVRVYADQFIIDMRLDKSELKSYHIGFSDLFQGNIVGVCIYGVRSIFLRRDYWKFSSDIEKRALVYHELGHCVCNSFGHNENFDVLNKCPESIMYPEIPSEYCLNKQWNYYVSELRSVCKGK